MKISYSPNNYEPTGIVSFKAWTDPELQAAFRRAFSESPREAINEIIIERKGVKAVFEKKNC